MAVPQPADRTIFRAADHASDGKLHLLIACTGSVATIKLPVILTALSRHSPRLSIRLVLSATATAFLAGQTGVQPTPQQLLAVPGVDGLHLDADEWTPAWTRGAPVLHIELRRWADVMLVAPLSADALGKVALGLADNLVTSVLRAWDTTGLIDGLREGVGSEIRTKEGLKRVLLAPAMNTAMWLHPVTGKHMKVLEEWSEKNGGWITILPPIEKELACGDVGGGAMMEAHSIVAKVESVLGFEVHAGDAMGTQV